MKTYEVEIAGDNIGALLRGVDRKEKFIKEMKSLQGIADMKPVRNQVTKQCLDAGIAACKVGNRISDISKAVYAIADKAGYGVVYDYCGHGVGLSVHEEPNIPNVPGRGVNPRIQAGMVLAIEPMINLGVADVYVDSADEWTVLTEDGKVSCHEEHTVAVFADHTEILTIL